MNQVTIYRSNGYIYLVTESGVEHWKVPMNRTDLPGEIVVAIERALDL